MPSGSIPRVSLVVVVVVVVVLVTVENTREQELGTRRNTSWTEWRTNLTEKQICTLHVPIG